HDLVAERVAARDLHHLRADVALDQAEDVRVRAALALRHELALVGAGEGEALDLRELVGHELLGEVEAAAADDVLVDVPADLLRRFDGFRVAGGACGQDCGIHVSLRGWRVALRCCELASRCAAMSALTSSACVIGHMWPASAIASARTSGRRPAR